MSQVNKIKSKIIFLIIDPNSKPREAIEPLYEKGVEYVNR
jgi:hypothetical protein